MPVFGKIKNNNKIIRFDNNSKKPTNKLKKLLKLRKIYV